MHGGLPTTEMYDVTFRKKEDLQTCMLPKGKKEGDKVLEGIIFLSSETKVRVPIAVHMYNPFVQDEEIPAFLFRYCKSVSAGVKLMNVLDIFNGQCKLWVIFRADREGLGGVRHPPQSFSIGRNLGYLWYPGQPIFCRQCFAFGHTKDQCKTRFTCSNCFKQGHRAGQCPEKKSCHICGSRMHVARQCPKVARMSESTAVVVAEKAVEAEVVVGKKALSYADVARMGSVPITAVDSVEQAVVRADVFPPMEGESGPSPVDAMREEGASSVPEESVPGHLMAEGELEGSGEETEESEEEMEVGQLSLKRKMEVAESSQVMGSFRDSPDPGTSEAVIDSDCSQAPSYASTGQVFELQEVMGYCRVPKEKVKKKIGRVSPGSGVGPRTRARDKEGKKKKKIMTGT